MSNKKKKFMHTLKVGAVSLVGKAANGRDFPLFKSADASSGGKNTKEENSEMDFMELLKEKLSDILSNDDDLKKAAQSLRPDADDDKVNGDDKVTTWTTSSDWKGDDDKAQDKKVEGDDKVTKDDDTANETVTALFKAQQSTIEDLRKEITELKDLRKADAVVKEAAEIQRIVKGLEFVPADSSDLESMLKALKAADSDQFTKAVDVLRKMNKVVKSGAIFDMAGSNVTSLTKSVDAKVDAKAEAIRKSNPDMSDDEVMAKVFTDNPELYEAYYEDLPNVGDSDEV